MSQKSVPKKGYKKVPWLFRKEIEIPEEWEVKLLHEIGEPIIGLTYKPENVQSNGTLVLRAPNIQNEKLRFDDNVFVNVKVEEKLRVKKNDLLICVRNGSQRLIGKCAYINEDFENMTFGAFMSMFRSDFNSFIFQQFQSYETKKQITKKK